MIRQFLISFMPARQKGAYFMQTTKRLAVCGILTAAALTIFVLEAQLPPLVPVPGIKPGLANIVTLFALVFLCPRDAFLILLARTLLGAFLVGNPSILLYSLSGGLVCLGAETLLVRLCGQRQIWAVSAAGAAVHNLTQLLTAGLETRTASVLWYLPPLLAAGILTGLFTGLCVWYLNTRHRPKIMKWLRAGKP